MTWVALASTLIADLTVSPPKSRYVRGTFGPNDGGLVFTGRRMRELRAIYRAAEPAIDTPEWREWLRLDPETVVRAAIENRKDLAA